MSAAAEKWVLCPVCGAKTRLRLLQRTVLRDFPLFCPKCRRECLINAKNFQIELIDQPDAETQRRPRFRWSCAAFLRGEV